MPRSRRPRRPAVGRAYQRGHRQSRRDVPPARGRLTREFATCSSATTQRSPIPSADAGRGARTARRAQGDGLRTIFLSRLGSTSSRSVARRSWACSSRYERLVSQASVKRPLGSSTPRPAPGDVRPKVDAIREDELRLDRTRMNGCAVRKSGTSGFWPAGGLRSWPRRWCWRFFFFMG